MLDSKVATKYKKILEENEKERGETIYDLSGLLIESLIVSF